MSRYQVTVGANVRRYFTLEIDAPDADVAAEQAEQAFLDSPDEWVEADEQLPTSDALADEPDVQAQCEEGDRVEDDEDGESEREPVATAGAES